MTLVVAHHESVFLSKKFFLENHNKVEGSRVIILNYSLSLGLTSLKFIFLIKTNYLIQPRITALVIWLAKRMANQMTPNYGAKIWNEYIFLLKCNMATIWTQNLYFSDLTFSTRNMITSKQTPRGKTVWYKNLVI